MSQFRMAVLAAALLVAAARGQAGTDGGQAASNDTPTAAGAQESPAVQASMPEGQVETAWTFTPVRKAEAFLYVSEPNRPDLDGPTRRAISDTLRTNDGNPILWVRLQMDVSDLTRFLADFDPSNPRIDPNHLGGSIGPREPELSPLAPKGQIKTDGPNRYLEQNLVFALPANTSSLELRIDVPNRLASGQEAGPPRRMSLAIFSFSRLLLSVDKIFPKVRPEGGLPRSLSAITRQANKLGIGRIDPNHVRFFNQPAGIVTDAVDIDLVTGELILYPGTHDRWNPRRTVIEPGDLAVLREVLTSEAFARIPEQGSRLGMDGHSYFIEVDLNGSYWWKLHWSPDDETLKRIAEQFRTLYLPLKVSLIDITEPAS